MLDEDDIAAIVRAHLSAREAASSIVRVDMTPRPAGATLQLGPKRYEMPFDGYFVFVDLLPQANWSHRARVLLVGHGADIETFDVGFPPFPDAAYPPNFKIIDLSAVPT